MDHFVSPIHLNTVGRNRSTQCKPMHWVNFQTSHRKDPDWSAYSTQNLLAVWKQCYSQINIKKIIIFHWTIKKSIQIKFNMKQMESVWFNSSWNNQSMVNLISGLSESFSTEIQRSIKPKIYEEHANGNVRKGNSLKIEVHIKLYWNMHIIGKATTVHLIICWKHSHNHLLDQH